MNLLGHLTFVLIAVSYLVRDIFLLRILSIVASVVGTFYYYLVPAEPLWLVINWNLVFLAVNCVQLALIVYDRRKITFSAEQKELFETIFLRFSPIEFLKLMRLSQWQEAPASTQLTTEGEPVSQILLIYSGEAGVYVKDKKVNTLKDGDFIGEMSFLSEQDATATVRLEHNSRYLVWDKSVLSQLLQRNPNLRFAMQALIGEDLTRKLRRKLRRND